jgi:hypothetical protein
MAARYSFLGDVGIVLHHGHDKGTTRPLTTSVNWPRFDSVSSLGLEGGFPLVLL